ncbi:MAG: hypothetical protein COA93_03895, partial [Alphaproteobacteria bacterium]
LTVMRGAGGGLIISVIFTIIASNSLWGWYMRKRYLNTQLNNQDVEDPLRAKIQPNSSVASKSHIPKSPSSNFEDDTSLRSQRLNEEKLYAQVATEMDSDDIRAGLWAKATVDAEGEEGKTKALYIKYRLQAIQDEVADLVMETEEQITNNLSNQSSLTDDELQIQNEINTLKEEAENSDFNSQSYNVYVSTGSSISDLKSIGELSDLKKRIDAAKFKTDIKK